MSKPQIATKVDSGEKGSSLVSIGPRWYAPRFTVLARTPTKPSIRSQNEFFRPLTVDGRANFFAVYRKESKEFRRGYGKKCDGDLKISLIFVSRKMFI